MPLPAPPAPGALGAPASTGPLAWALALLALAVLLALGTGLGKLLGSRSWGVPEALIAGALGLLVAPAGALPLLPQAVIAVWEQLPLILLTLVFGTLLLGKPLPRAAQLWRPLSAQILLALTLAFGQYLMAALVVLALSSRLEGIHPLLACLIEVAYEGGHGSAAAMGPTYARLGFPGGEALGLAMATVGLLSSTLVGGVGGGAGATVRLAGGGTAGWGSGAGGGGGGGRQGWWGGARRGWPRGRGWRSSGGDGQGS
jgi:ESS family glutamate:Na+ symporter